MWQKNQKQNAEAEAGHWSGERVRYTYLSYRCVRATASLAEVRSEVVGAGAWVPREPPRRSETPQIPYYSVTNWLLALLRCRTKLDHVWFTAPVPDEAACALAHEALLALGRHPLDGAEM